MQTSAMFAQQPRNMIESSQGPGRSVNTVLWAKQDKTISTRSTPTQSTTKTKRADSILTSALLIPLVWVDLNIGVWLLMNKLR